MRCRICRNLDGNRTHVAREMMFGTRERFSYVECGECGCLQLAEIPSDMGRFYEQGYYSMTEPPARLGETARNFVKRKRAAHLLHRSSPVGWLAEKAFGKPTHWTWLEHAGVTLDSRIADVGCGAGQLLRELRAEGFRDLTGVEPFLPAPISDVGFRILNAFLGDVRETFDLVMLNHSLEHMADQDEAMRAVARVTAPGRTVLVRVPLVAWAWRNYGTDWAQLDAPRHFVLHTERSMRAVAERAGFTVTRVEYDSWEFQFWGSEQYRRDVPLHDPRSCDRNPAHPLFTDEEMLAFRSRARDLNARGEGDQACFYLRRA